MPDRTINFGESETEATYQIQDTDGAAGGGNFVVAKDTNANTVLLEYDPASDTWEYAGDVDMNGGNVSGVGTLTADSVNTEELTNHYLYAGAFDGASPDDRLSNALSAASKGEVIHLENATYTTDLTVSKRVSLVGTSAALGSDTTIDASFTFDDRVTIRRITLSGSASITLNGRYSSIINAAGGVGWSLTVDGDNVRCIGLVIAELTFTSNARNGIVDASTAVTVTDNGSNTVGDIA